MLVSLMMAQAGHPEQKFHQSPDQDDLWLESHSFMLPANPRKVAEEGSALFHGALVDAGYVCLSSPLPSDPSWSNVIFTGKDGVRRFSDITPDLLDRITEHGRMIEDDALRMDWQLHGAQASENGMDVLSYLQGIQRTDISIMRRPLQMAASGALPEGAIDWVDRMTSVSSRMERLEARQELDHDQMACFLAGAESRLSEPLSRAEVPPSLASRSMRPRRDMMTERIMRQLRNTPVMPDVVRPQFSPEYAMGL